MYYPILKWMILSVSHDMHMLRLRWCSELSAILHGVVEWIIDLQLDITHQTPCWADIRTTMHKLSTMGIYNPIENNGEANLHIQCGYLIDYCTAEKILECRANNTKITHRWGEIFKYYYNNILEYSELSAINIFYLCQELIAQSNAHSRRSTQHGFSENNADNWNIAGTPICEMQFQTNLHWVL